ncbi:MAG: hypothetical protein IPJ88_06100 [Myxococcales bacterium]|nr:MAG: hypothetical protein IPJ88_06100 [Myxococcales bacterium]
MIRQYLLISAIAACFIVSCATTKHTELSSPEQHDPLSRITAKQLFDHGMSLSHHGDYLRAEQYLAASMDKGYPESKVVPALVEVCVLSSRLPSAVQYAEPFLERHPRLWSLRLVLASVYYSLGRYASSKRELYMAIEDAPKEPASAHYLLAMNFREEKNEEEIKVHAKRYLELAPKGIHAEQAEQLIRFPLKAAAEDLQQGPIRLESQQGRDDEQ